MRAVITAELVRNLPPGPCDIWDTKLPRFLIRVRANGTASYLVSLARGRWHTVGSLAALKPHEARETAQGVIGDVAKARSAGRDPIAELAAKRKAVREAARKPLTLEVFVRDHYEPYVLAKHKRGKETISRLRFVCDELLSERLTGLTEFRIEKWRTATLRRERKPAAATVNSHLQMLKTALNKAVAWRLLAANPIATVKKLKTDKTGRVRFLSADEETRLRAALETRDTVRRLKRANANAWRRERGYPEWPAENPNHLTAIVRLALNTGLRKGEIFGLRWTDVDLAGASLTIRGAGAKNGQTRYVPLNSEAIDVLTTWQQADGDHGEYVFAGREEGEPLDDVKKAWQPVLKAAAIDGFRFHDLRHTFASKLVMAGVDLNTVRELLGHSDIKMTLRYAHLAPEHKASAVAKLVARA